MRMPVHIWQIWRTQQWQQWAGKSWTTLFTAKLSLPVILFGPMKMNLGE
jgi:hypothetical protein